MWKCHGHNLPMEITLQDSADGGAKDQLSPLPCLYLPFWACWNAPMFPVLEGSPLSLPSSSCSFKPLPGVQGGRSNLELWSSAADSDNIPPWRRRTTFTAFTPLWQNPSQDQLRAGKVSFGYGFLGDHSSWQRRNGQAAYSWSWELVDENLHAMTHQEAEGMPGTKVGINFRDLPVEQYFPQLGLTTSR